MMSFDRVLTRLTLEQKIAQLQGLSPYELIAQTAPTEIPDDLDLSVGIPYDLSRVAAVRPHGVGHLSLAWTLNPDLDRLRCDLDRFREYAREVNPLGIGTLVHAEAVSGLVHEQADQFPTPWGQAATWNPELTFLLAQHAARQARTVGVQLVFSPVLDIARDPRWGRAHETYGEDPELVTRMGLAFIRGVQGIHNDSGVRATGKHFLGYGASLGGLNQATTALGRRELRDVYAEPFRRAIAEADLTLIMNSYNDVDGIPAAANAWLLRELLRDELGFDGLVVSDYDSIAMLWKTHRTAASPAEAAIAALTAGLDVELPGASMTAGLADAVHAGEISEQLIDDAVRRVLHVKAELGLVPDISPRTRLAPTPPAVGADALALARQIAGGALTLVKNDGVLPVRPGSAKIAVTGPAADEIRIHFGAYSSVANAELPMAMGQIMAGAIPGVEASMEVFTDLFQIRLPGIAPLFETAARRLHPHSATLVNALQAIDPGVTYHPFGNIEIDDVIDEAALAAAVGDADIVIAAVGERTGWVGNHTAGEGRTTADPTLPGNQTALIQALHLGLTLFGGHRVRRLVPSD
ncbi:glycoside hydrolase family 3 protein [Mycolicibacterium mucogenicum]|nr:glycoside hydrolase family 3 N-terminal domain-containing protein [Mycolicibacterium mucogenicum]